MAVGRAEKMKLLIPKLARLHNEIAATLNERLFADFNKIAPLMEELKQITIRHNQMMRRVKAKPHTGEKLKLITDSIRALQDLDRRVDKTTEIFVKYDVPKLHEFETLEAYTQALMAFMRVWRDEAEKRREDGERSLLEWLHRLENAKEKREILRAMRLVAIDLGTKISSALASYFILSSIFAMSRDDLEQKIHEVYMAIETLKVDENSALIEKFLDTVRYTRYMLRQFSVGAVSVKNSASVLSDLLYLILREVLRLEVAFCCPDLPMMLTGEVLVGMGNYLLTEVFEERVSRVSQKAEEVWNEIHGSVSDDESEMYCIHGAQVLEQGFDVIWNELEMKPSESYHT